MRPEGGTGWPAEDPDGQSCKGDTARPCHPPFVLRQHHGEHTAPGPRSLPQAACHLHLQHSHCPRDPQMPVSIATSICELHSQEGDRGLLPLCWLILRGHCFSGPLAHEACSSWYKCPHPLSPGCSLSARSQWDAVPEFKHHTFSWFALKLICLYKTWELRARTTRKTTKPPITQPARMTRLPISGPEKTSSHLAVKPRAFIKRRFKK